MNRRVQVLGAMWVVLLAIQAFEPLTRCLLDGGPDRVSRLAGERLLGWSAAATVVVGFSSAPAGGTAPVPPGPGSSSWTITGFHDGFRLEVTGNRTAPTSVSTYVVTPCLANA